MSSEDRATITIPDFDSDLFFVLSFGQSPVNEHLLHRPSSLRGNHHSGAMLRLTKHSQRSTFPLSWLGFCELDSDFTEIDPEEKEERKRPVSELNIA